MNAQKAFGKKYPTRGGVNGTNDSTKSNGTTYNSKGEGSGGGGSGSDGPDPQTMSVKEMKAELQTRGVNCSDCLEKVQFLQIPLSDQKP